MAIAAIATTRSSSSGHRAGARNTSTVRLALASVPAGVSTRSLQGTPVFLVRRGHEVAVLRTDVQHLPGERELWWCAQDHRFVSPLHGEVFDVAGQKLGGPSRAGLSRFRATVARDIVTIDVHTVVPGPPIGAHKRLPRGWAPGRAHLKNDGTCAHPLVAGRHSDT